MPKDTEGQPQAVDSMESRSGLDDTGGGGPAQKEV